MQQHVEFGMERKIIFYVFRRCLFYTEDILCMQDLQYIPIKISLVAKITIKTQPWLLDLKFCNQLVTAKLVLEDRL